MVSVLVLQIILELRTMLFQIGIGTGTGNEITGAGEVETGTVKEIQLGVAEIGGLPGQIGVKHHASRMSHSPQTSR